MNYNLNLAGAKPLGQFLKAGKYSVKVSGFEGKKSKNGHPQFLITFSQKDDGDFTHYANADVSNEFARDWLNHFLTCAGIPNNNGQYSFTTEQLVGKPVNIEIKREFNEHTGKMRNNLKRVWAYEGTPIYEKYEEVDDNAEIAKHGGNNKANDFSTASVPGTNNPFSNASGPIDIKDDDLPF